MARQWICPASALAEEPEGYRPTDILFCCKSVIVFGRRLLNGAPSTEVFDAKEGDSRSRRTLIYYYIDEKHMAEFVQTGHAFDLDTLVPTGQTYNRD